MQTTFGHKRSSLGRVEAIMVVTIITVLVLSVGLVVARDRFSIVGSDNSTTIIPKAHYVAEQGEGLVNGSNIGPATLKAHFAPAMGEGLVGGNVDAASQARTTSLVDGMGEGWVTTGRPQSASDTCRCQGEGLVGGTNTR